MSDEPNSTPLEEESPVTRQGDPLDGLWHWSHHPLVRAAILIAILIGLLVAFPLLAQVTF